MGFLAFLAGVATATILVIVLSVRELRTDWWPWTVIGIGVVVTGGFAALEWIF